MFADHEQERSPTPVSGIGLLGFVSAMVMLVVFYAGSDKDFIPVLDHANLAFHEAGHMIFGIPGNRTLAILGGTFGQLVFPLAVLVSGLRRGKPMISAFALLWLSQNLVNIAVYMADARALKLPLIGGLGAEAHDWRNLFSGWGMLQDDTLVASLTEGLAGIIILATCAWLFLQWYKSG